MIKKRTEKVGSVSVLDPLKNMAALTKKILNQPGFPVQNPSTNMLALKAIKSAS
jgi:hypothetical protein